MSVEVTPMGIRWPSEWTNPFDVEINQTYVDVDAIKEDSALVMTGGGEIGLAGDSFSWSAPFYVYSPRNGTFVTISAGSVTVTDGQSLYFTPTARPIPTQTLPLLASNVVPAGSVWCGTRSGTEVSLRTEGLPKKYWNRSGSTLSPSFSGDDIDVVAVKNTSGTLTIGELTASPAPVVIRGGTSGVIVGPVGDVSISPLGAATIDGPTGVGINSVGGAINIGQFAHDNEINIGTGGTRTITIGNSSSNVGIGTSSPNESLTIEEGVLSIKETTTPTATTNYGKIYTKSDNNLYFQDGAGSEHTVSVDLSAQNMDETYDAFGGPGTVAIDNGNLTFAPSGTNSYLVDVSGCTGAIDGFQVSNGADYFRAIYAAVDSLSITSELSNFSINSSAGVTIDSSSGDIEIGNAANAGTISLGNSSSSRVINIGNSFGSTAMYFRSGSGGIGTNIAGNIQLNSTAGSILIGDGAYTGLINIGTSTTARTITVGNNNGATSVNMDSGTGGFNVDSTGGVSIESDDTTTINMAANNASNRDLQISATNSGAGQGRMILIANDYIHQEVGGGAVGIDITSASNKLSLFSNTGPVEIDAVDTAHFKMTANDASDKTLTIQASNSGAAGGKVLIESDANGDAAIYINASSGGVILSASSTSTIWAKEADGVFLQNGSGNMVFNCSAGEMRFNDSFTPGSWSIGHIPLSSNSTEWTTFESNFGEVSFLNAINQAAANVGDLDAGYNAFGGAGTVTIDNGNLTFAPTGTDSLVVDVSGLTDFSNGFLVENGSDYFRIRRGGNNIINITAAVSQTTIYNSSTWKFYKDSVYTSEGTASVLMADSSGNHTGCLFGADITESAFYIQSIDPGTSYTTRYLALNPNGGNVGIGTVTPNESLTIEEGVLSIKETTTPTATTNYGKIYTKSDNNLYFQDGAGVEHTVTIS